MKPTELAKTLEQSPVYAAFYLKSNVVHVALKEKEQGPTALQLLAAHMAANPQVYANLKRQVQQLQKLQKPSKK